MCIVKPSLFYLVLLLLVAASYTTANFCDRSFDDPCSGAASSADFVDGDLVSPRLVDNRRKRAATSQLSHLWPEGKVNYIIGTGPTGSVYTDKERNTILEAMCHIENKTCIRFIEGENPEAYINIFPGTACCSYVGRIGCGKQGVSIAKSCLSVPTVIHEILHALGFYHEHNRPDRDDYINVLEENINPAAIYNFLKLGTEAVNSLGVGYDYNSIMHYHDTAFSVVVGKITLESIDPNIPIGGATELSPLDIIQTNLLYKCNVTDPPPLTTICPADPPPPPLTLPYPNRGEIIDAELSGTITSPGYPDPEMYPHSQTYGWVFRAPEGHNYRLKITISIDFTSGCTKDYVQVHYGVDQSSSSSSKYCGNRVVTFSGTSEYLLIFKTDSSNDNSFGQTYQGISATYQAKDINECKRGYNNICSHKCKNTKGSFHCTCREGWYLSGNGFNCFDVHECALDNGGCDHNCNNFAGSYNCSCSEGYMLQADGKSCVVDGSSSCSDNNGGCSQLCDGSSGNIVCSCHTGYKLLSNGQTCVDVNECETTGVCSQICLNTEGSYKCGCNEGYESRGSQCIDINECTTLSSDETCGPHVCGNYAGSFYCLCMAGYTYGQNIQTCIDLDECLTNNGECEHSCTNIDGSYECSCNPGYEIGNDGKSCEDVNECALENGGCDHNCTNFAGSYNCSCREGYMLQADGKSCVDDGSSSCSDNNGGCNQLCDDSSGNIVCSCYTGHNLLSNGQTCVDINECTTLSSDETCGPHVCGNYAGSFYCLCMAGYTYGQNIQTCIDLDECLTNNDECEHSCTNNVGSYECSCNPGYEIGNDGKSCDDLDECLTNNGGCEHSCTNIDGSYECSCNPGYKIGNDGKSCDDVNECETTGVCSQVCINTEGSYECECYEGYESRGPRCIDINECTTLSSDETCGPHVCRNSPGSFYCLCMAGYTQGQNIQTCIDLDECLTNNGECEHSCTNIDGSYECSCNPGYEIGNDGKSCEDVNECALENGGCDHNCTNFAGSYNCSCREGYMLQADGKSCVDDSSSSCSDNNGGCNQLCDDSSGNIVCSCHTGYKLLSNGQTCVDVNECETTGVCSQVCINTEGSYKCECYEGYYSRGPRCRDINECNDEVNPCSHICNNVPGSYYCTCPEDHILSSDNSTCNPITECGGNLTDNSATISMSDTAVTNCTWRISLSDASRYISLNIKEVMFTSTDCLGGYIEVFNGDSTEAVSMGKYCNETAIEKIESATNQLMVRYYSTGGGSFSANYTIVDKPRSITSCYGVISVTPNGSPKLISSPNFPQKYANKQTCNFYVYSTNFGAKVQFKVQYLDLCPSDTIEFFDTFSPNELIASISEVTPNMVYTSTKPFTLIRFKGNTRNTCKGFLGSVEAIN